MKCQALVRESFGDFLAQEFVIAEGYVQKTQSLTRFVSAQFDGIDRFCVFEPRAGRQHAVTRESKDEQDDATYTAAAATYGISDEDNQIK